MLADRDRDTLNRFLLDQTNVRGELVHLDATWQAILERRQYPEPVRDLLGQAMAAAALLATTIKFDGSLTMQISGDGPVSLLVVQATAQRTLRGLAHWREDLTAGTFADLIGTARLVMTIDPGEGRERYQGIVALENEPNLALAITDYFERSEQLGTRLWLAANGERAAGMLLQALPGSRTDDEDAWERSLHLGATLTDQELLDLGHRDILHRLFHEEDVRLFEAEPVSFRCSCSAERIENMLRGLGYDEVQDILREEGVVSVDCEFCGHHYEYDQVDAEQLFASIDQPPVSPTRH